MLTVNSDNTSSSQSSLVLTFLIPAIFQKSSEEQKLREYTMLLKVIDRGKSWLLSPTKSP